MVYLDYNPIQSFSLAANEELQGAILPDGTFSSDFGDATLKQGLPLHLPGSAHLGQLGLWGYVDEVRFTRKALSAEEFLEPCTIRCTVMTFK